MTRVLVRTVVGGTVATVAAAAVYLVVSAPPRHPAPDLPVPLTLAAQPSNADNHDFTITSGTSSCLYPGGTARVPLSVSNPYSFDILLTNVSASITGTSSAACPATPANVVVRAYQGALPLTVPSGRTVAAGSVPVSMPGTVAQACQNVTFTLHLQGTATKAKP